MTNSQRKAEIADLKRELHAGVRASVAHMNSVELARYRAGLSVDHRRAFDVIMGAPHKRDAERERLCGLMDQKMGLSSTSMDSVVRTEHELRASVFSDPRAARPRSAASQKVSSPGLYPRQTPHTRATTRSPQAAAMDIAMGFEPAPATRCSPNELVLSVFR